MTESPGQASGRAQAKVTIKIPRALYNNLKEVIAGSGFNSVTDFIVYVLRDIVSAERTSRAGADRLTTDELEAVRRRLKALGYL